jgi:hypothetical protein
MRLGGRLATGVSYGQICGCPGTLMRTYTPLRWLVALWRGRYSGREHRFLVGVIAYGAVL